MCFQLSSISIRILSHTLILRLGYFTLNFFRLYAICHSPQQKSDLTFSIIHVQTLVPSASMPLC